jgi:hypothetical protein
LEVLAKLNAKMDADQTKANHKETITNIDAETEDI